MKKYSYLIITLVLLLNWNLAKSQASFTPITYTPHLMDMNLYNAVLSAAEAQYNQDRESYMRYYNSALQEMGKNSPNYSLAASNLKMCDNITKSSRFSVFQENREILLEKLLECYQKSNDKFGERQCLTEIFVLNQTITNAERVLKCGYEENAMFFKLLWSIGSRNDKQADLCAEEIIDNSAKDIYILSFAYNYKANTLTKQKDYDKALLFSNKAVLLYPSPENYITKSTICDCKGDYLTCIEELNYVLKNSKKEIKHDKNKIREYSELYYWRGKSYYEIGDMKSAKKDLKKSSKMGFLLANRLLKSIDQKKKAN